MKILIVEDDELLAKSLVTILSNSGMVCDCALTGKEGFSYIEMYQYDLIVLDLMLPDIRGDELVNMMRKNKYTCPVLVLSGLAEDTSKTNLLNLGADDYLTKPFSANELIARIKAIVRRTKGVASSLVKIGDLSVDIGAQVVKYKDKTINLTKKEFSILELLALKKDKVVGKINILEYLYDGLNEPEPKIIDVFVCKLRRKLKKETNQDFVATVWGQGYTIKTPEDD